MADTEDNFPRNLGLVMLALVVIAAYALVVSDLARKHDKCLFHAATGQACK